MGRRFRISPLDYPQVSAMDALYQGRFAEVLSWCISPELRVLRQSKGPSRLARLTCSLDEDRDDKARDQTLSTSPSHSRILSLYRKSGVVDLWSLGLEFSDVLAGRSSSNRTYDITMTLQYDSRNRSGRGGHRVTSVSPSRLLSSLWPGRESTVSMDLVRLWQGLDSSSA